MKLNDFFNAIKEQRLVIEEGVWNENDAVCIYIRKYTPDVLANGTINMGSVMFSKSAGAKQAEANGSTNTIKIGSRVRLKGDANSPEMTVIKSSSSDFRGVQDSAAEVTTVFECAWFTDKNDDDYQGWKLRYHTFHKDALELIIPTEPKKG